MTDLTNEERAENEHALNPREKWGQGTDPTHPISAIEPLDSETPTAADDATTLDDGELTETASDCAGPVDRTSTRTPPDGATTPGRQPTKPTPRTTCHSPEARSGPVHRRGPGTGRCERDEVGPRREPAGALGAASGCFPAHGRVRDLDAHLSVGRVDGADGRHRRNPSRSASSAGIAAGRHANRLVGQRDRCPWTNRRFTLDRPRCRRWTLTSKDSGGCTAIGAIHSPDGQVSVEVANTSVSGKATRSGSKSAGRLSAGTYLVTFATTCSWTAAVYRA